MNLCIIFSLVLSDMLWPCYTSILMSIFFKICRDFSEFFVPSMQRFTCLARVAVTDVERCPASQWLRSQLWTMIERAHSGGSSSSFMTWQSSANGSERRGAKASRYVTTNDEIKVQFWKFSVCLVKAWKTSRWRLLSLTCFQDDKNEDGQSSKSN